MSDQPKYQLSDEDRAEADRLNAAEGVVWREKAKFISERLSAKITMIDEFGQTVDVPMTARYQSCAYALRLGISTARMYVRLETAFGAVLDECRTPDGDEIASPFQLRQIYSEARKRNLSPDEALIRRIRESDKYGGQVAPPDVIAAQTRNGRASDPPELAALKRGARCIASLARKTESKPDRLIYESWVRHLEKRIKESE